MSNETACSLKPSEVRSELANLQRNIEMLGKTIRTFEGRYASVLRVTMDRNEKESLPEKSIVSLAGEIRDINRQLIQDLKYIEDIIQRCEL